MAFYRLQHKDGRVNKVRRMTDEVARALNSELDADEWQWCKGLDDDSHQELRSVTPLLRSLDTEGFDEHSLNMITRYLRKKAKLQAKEQKSYDATLEQYRTFMRTQPPEVRQLVGRFMTEQCKRSFNTGLVLGLSGKATRDALDDEGGEK